MDEPWCGNAPAWSPLTSCSQKRWSSRESGAVPPSVQVGERLLAEPFEIVWSDRALVDAARKLKALPRPRPVACDCDPSLSCTGRVRRRSPTTTTSDAVGFSSLR